MNILSDTLLSFNSFAFAFAVSLMTTIHIVIELKIKEGQRKAFERFND